MYVGLGEVAPLDPAITIADRNASLPVTAALVAAKDDLTASYTKWQERLEGWRNLSLGPLEVGSLVAPIIETSRLAWVNYDKWIKDYVIAMKSDLSATVNANNAQTMITAAWKMSSGYKNAYLYTSTVSMVQATLALLSGISKVTWFLTGWAVTPVAEALVELGNKEFAIGGAVIDAGEHAIGDLTGVFKNIVPIALAIGAAYLLAPPLFAAFLKSKAVDRSTSGVKEA